MNKKILYKRLNIFPICGKMYMNNYLGLLILQK